MNVSQVNDPFTIHFGWEDVTATYGEDYVGHSTSVTIDPPPGSSYLVPVQLTTHQSFVDNDVESTESFRFALSQDPGQRVGWTVASGVSETVTIEIEDTPPIVQFAGGADGAESPDDDEPVTYTVHREYGDLTEALDVYVDLVGGTAGSGDYQSPPTHVEIPPNEQHATFSVTPIDDGEIEPHETLVAQIQPSPDQSYVIDEPDEREQRILDNDIFVALVSGHTQEDPNNSVLPAPGVGIWGVRTALIAEGVHPDNIFVSSEAGPNHEAAEDRVYNEVTQAIGQAGDRTLDIAMIGYSHGGGLIYDVSVRLAATDPALTYDLFFTGYIDAFQHDGFYPEGNFFAQTVKPVMSGYHMNWYQSVLDFSILNGKATEDGDFNFDFDAGGNAASHFSIDDFTAVHDGLAENLVARMD